MSTPSGARGGTEWSRRWAAWGSPFATSVSWARRSRSERAHETLVANGLPQAAHRRDDPVPPRAPDGVDI